MASVPLIDLHQSHAPNVVQDVAYASREWGFFQVINHGIDVEFLTEVQDVAMRFFNLPMEAKLELAAKRFGLREDGYGNHQGVATREFLLVYTLPLESRNIKNWPVIPGFKDKITRLSNEFLILAQKLLALLSEGLGLEPTYLENKFGEPVQSILLNLYPACSDPTNSFGLPPHSDHGGLSLLFQTTPGLHVLKDDAWILVEPVHGAITVNIADMLELMSNGKYKSVTHQARMNKTHARLSIASSYGSSSDTLISPASELIDLEHPQLYKPLVCGDYEENYIAVVKASGQSNKSFMFLEYGENSSSK